MIFVTVGTHEQQFNRLLKEIDRLVETKVIKEEVFIQTGYSDYEPKHCKWSKLIPYKEMEQKVKDARIVITHGGPASFIAPLQIGKTPIVVPRQFEFDEHVNNHQLEFAREVEARMKNIIVVETEEQLNDSIVNYSKKVQELSGDMASNNKRFNEELKKEIKNLFEE